ncbi:MAG TPA: CotH kinase family protein [Pedobacter sp.]|nr:CotH kinase family protein [Pedobacter sp.]
MRKSLLYLFCLLILWSCKKEDPIIIPDEPEPVEVKDSVKLLSVKLEPVNNKGLLITDVYAKIVGNQINVKIPSSADNQKFVPTFSVENAIVTVNDTVQVSGKTAVDFNRVITYKLTSPKGKTETFTFNVKYYTEIPILYIYTTDSVEVTSKDNYINGRVVINTNGLYTQEQNNIPLQIKGRGNSTWGMEKKPYRLKFTNKAPMLGMPTAKNWVLLANYSDKTLMRTSLAFDLGTKLGVDFTPQGRPVELVMNKKYLGSYFLTYQVEVNENRVNIPELKKSNTSATEITGGYLLELDQRRDSDPRFETNRGIPLTIKSPEDITPQQLDYIKTYIQETEDVINSEDFSANGYEKYINVESFINWYIIQELMSNQDAKDFSSIFFYKDRGGKLGLGPLWDFDLAAGNNDYSDSRYPTGWWIKDGPWFSHLFKDPKFVAKLKTRWNAVKANELKQIPATIDQNVKYINLSQYENFNRWPILNKWVWPNQFVLGSYPAEIAQLKKWLNERISWLDIQINAL